MLRNPAFALLVSLAAMAAGMAVEIRIATFNIGADFSGGNSSFSLGAPGTPDHDSVRDILLRMDADVVALQEIHSADTAGSPDHLNALGASAGYPHRYVPQFTSLDFTFRVVILSRFPIMESIQISSPAGANEIARRFPAVRVDVPGTDRDPLIISTHIKAGTLTVDRFRKAVEMRRLAVYLSGSGLTADDNFIILGDFNLSSNNLSFFSAPDNLPNSYSLGDDIIFPVSYSTNPLSYFQAPAVVRLDPRHLNGSPSTFNTATTSGGVLDLVLVSPAIAGRPLASEIYNSDLDTSNALGLRKAGNPLPAATSAIASDHYAIFVDVELDQDYPQLALTASTPVFVEGGSDARLTVTLPAARNFPVLVQLVSDQPSAAVSAQLTIPAGATVAGTAVSVPRNFLIDGPRTVTFTASASAYDPASASVEILDRDGPYIFTSSGQEISEDFAGFTGNHPPAPWSTSGGAWGGNFGFRSTGEGSIGHLGNKQTATASTTFTNQSASPLSALQIGIEALQWLENPGGSADFIAAEIIHDGTRHPLPGLKFESGKTSLQILEQALDGLRILPGETFELCFSFIPGAGGGEPPADVFINEFHYDNSGADVGEFVEIVVGPGFAGELSSVSLVLYNGANGAAYGTHALNTFVPGAVTPSGHRIFHKAIEGIQNGDPDGFALLVNGVVTEFISYEGSFAASSGPAAGMVSRDIGFSQNGSDPVGLAALGLRGSGGTRVDFTWTKFTGQAHTPGTPNPQQAFESPLPAQGLAINSLSVTAIHDPLLDSDGDGQTDDEERIFGTDPFDATSSYRVTIITGTNPQQLRLETLAGRRYLIETSDDLSEWSALTEFSGTGSIASVLLPQMPGRRFYRARVLLEP